MSRSAVVAALREIAALLELQGASRFKSRAFERGARSLEASRTPLERLVDERTLLELPAVGVSIANQIEELFRTGRSELLESLREGLPSGVLELSQIPGIGLHALRTLHQELGIATIDDLRSAAHEGRLRAVRGFGEKREASILAAIERYETTAPKIALAEGLRLAASLESEITSLEGVRSAHLVGSLRRFSELSDEIAFVVTTDAPARALAASASMPRVGSVERRDDRHCRLRLADGTRLEIFACLPSELPRVLVEATSSRVHWESILARGVALEAQTFADEADVYRQLGLAWVPPELREDPATTTPVDGLIERADVRGFVHCHTTWSDGKDGIEELARAAEERGAEFITITDHSRSAHYAGGLDLERLSRQQDEIAAIQERVGIRILSGSEVDILADGALDLPDVVLERLDVVIASIHSRHRQDEAAMTDRLLRAMRHPLFKIWGHPLGRLLTSRPPIPLRVEEVLDALAESRGAIEINGDPHRLDLEPRWVREARARGIPLVLSVDAHSIRALDNLEYAVGLARRAAVRKGEVLNASSAEAFARAVKPV